MNRESYAIEDFLIDESFQQWVLNPDILVEAEWEKWLEDFPGKSKIVEEAKEILTQIKSSVEKEIEKDEDKVWIKIENSIKPLS